MHTITPMADTFLDTLLHVCCICLHDSARTLGDLTERLIHILRGTGLAIVSSREVVYHLAMHAGKYGHYTTGSYIAFLLKGRQQNRLKNVLTICGIDKGFLHKYKRRSNFVIQFTPKPRIQG